MCTRLTLMLLVSAMDLLFCLNAAHCITTLILTPVNLIEAVCRLL